MKKYKIGSLFDGSGGFPLAASKCGIVPTWASEVEPYPIAVTKSRFPNMKHLGDISKINGAEIEPVDIITFGSPCQDLSVAGKRAGLKHEANGDEETTRSGLFMEAVRIIKEMRKASNGLYPRFALWENVPGAFSSNKGEDFRIVLEELIKIVEPSAVMPEVPQKGWPYADSYCGDGWSISYRVFDAQYWGVPQRRRRIHLVLDLGGECAQKVLFEREGLRGYFAESGTPWEGTTAHAEGSIGTADYEGEGVGIINLNKGDVQSKAVLDPAGIAPSLYAGECRYGGGECYVLDKESAPVGLDLYNLSVTGDTAATVSANSCMTATRNGPSVAIPYTLKIRSGVAVDSGGKVAGKGALIQTDKAATLAAAQDQYLFQPIAVATQQGGAEITENGICPTITASAGMSGNNQPWICKPVGFDVYNMAVTGDVSKTLTSIRSDADHVPCVMESKPVFCIEGNGQRESHRGDGYIESDTMYTLNTVEHHAVAYSMKSIARNGVPLVEQANPICASDYKDPDIVAHPVIASTARYIVRRLTPTECARLQGFADLWGCIDAKDDFTDEEYEFWLDVRNTHATINGKPTKEYTKQQMLTWYNKLHTDSAEYKMWGNGIALPPALYCMQGIADVLRNRSTE